MEKKEYKNKPLVLKAYAAYMASWSFCVKDQESGKLLPILPESFSIKSYAPYPNYPGAFLVLECELDLNLPFDNLLELEIEKNQYGQFLICEEGFIKPIVPPEINDDNTRIKCVIPIYGFSQENNETHSDLETAEAVERWLNNDHPINP